MIQAPYKSHLINAFSWTPCSPTLIQKCFSFSYPSLSNRNNTAFTCPPKRTSKAPTLHHLSVQASTSASASPAEDDDTNNTSLNAFSSSSTPAVTQPPQQEQNPSKFMSVLRKLAMVILGVLVLGIANVAMGTLGFGETTKTAVNLLSAAGLFIAWWQDQVTSQNSQKVGRVGVEDLEDNQPIRFQRPALKLPFADGKFWDFTVWPRKYFGRDFTTKDTVVFGIFVFMHAVSLLAPFTFTWPAFCAFFFMHVLTGMVGITFSYHRQLTHKSFTTPKWFEYLCAWIGCLALQGDPIEWVSAHRHHHAGCDTAIDPHSPYDGFFWSHMGWMFDQKGTAILADTKNASDLWNQPFYVFLRNTYPFHPGIVAILFYLIGGLPFLVWGVALRVVSLWHVTWLVNSASHVWGFQSWDTKDISMNNWWVGLLAFGEGWHNNHHAFEDSARHGLEWWQFDLTWYFIKFLAIIGIAKNIRLPKQSRMEALKLSNA